MARPTRVLIDHTALLHNVRRIRELAPGKKIVAMVKANAYGCGLSAVIPTLDNHVDAFGVACTEEAMIIRQLGSRTPCILFQGIFSKDELSRVLTLRLQCVIHQALQLQWILETPLPQSIQVHVKIDTGMHRLGFPPEEVGEVLDALRQCPWVDNDIGLMTHLASADVPDCPSNRMQLETFRALPYVRELSCSAANSAAILALPEAHFDVVRPGLMLYGISPFREKTGLELGLLPVMRLMSVVSTIRHYRPHEAIGYGGTWQSDKPTTIGVIPVGYGDGYPRHISADTPIFVNGVKAPIVGRVSMDMLTVDLSRCQSVQTGDVVELWGKHIPVEAIAQASSTVPYELICQLSSRVRF